MLIENPRGNYSFLKGVSPFSAGAAAAAGFEIEHARLQPPRRLQEGFEAIEARLKTLGRPKQALCGVELRSPRPFSFQGFADFNAGYVNILKSWDIPRDGLNPVARTNVAPEMNAPPEPVVYGFSYTIPTRNPGKTFVIAGAGELPEGSLDPHDVVRRGETSPDALVEKCRFVMRLMEARLRELGVDWAAATTTEIYTVHDICSFLRKEILERMGAAGLHGVVWHYARPPIVSIEYEMDVRGCRSEVVLGR